MDSWKLRVAVVLVWFGMLALLARETWVMPPTVTLPVDSLVPVETWMNVHQDGRKVGVTHQAWTVEGDAVTIHETTRLRLQVLGTPQLVHTELKAVLSRDYSLQQAEFKLVSAGGSFHARADREEDGLNVELDLGSHRSQHRIGFDDAAFLPQAWRASMRGENLQVGRTFAVSVWDPLTAARQQLTFRVVERETVPERSPPTDAWKVIEEVRGVRTTAWMSEDGTVWREEGPLGFVLVRSSREDAMADLLSDEPEVDIARLAAIPVGEIAAAREMRRLRVRLRGVVRPIPTDSEQHRGENEEMTIERLALDAGATYALPAQGVVPEYLAATMFLQSDHPRIRLLAREILVGESDAQRVARKLNDWVHEYLEKTPTISVPNALQVIDTGRGDCNEHAVLLVALSRASGLPARVVAGLVYMDGHFLYHAWAEVWLGRWVSVDPALRQFPADATHIKLIEGGPEVHGDLLASVGQITIDVIEAAPW